MAGLMQVPGFYAMQEAVPTTGMAAGFEGGADAARRTMAAEQAAQVAGLQEGRAQRKLPAEIEQAMANAAVNRAAATRSSALLPGDVAKQPVDVELVRAQTQASRSSAGFSDANTRALNQATTLGLRDDTQRRAAAAQTSLPSLPSGPAGPGQPAGLGPLPPPLESFPQVTLPPGLISPDELSTDAPSGGGGDGALQQPAAPLSQPQRDRRDLLTVPTFLADSFLGLPSYAISTAAARGVNMLTGSNTIDPNMFTLTPFGNRLRAAYGASAPKASPTGDPAVLGTLSASPASPAPPAPPPAAPGAPGAPGAPPQADAGAAPAAPQIDFNDPIVALKQNYSALQSLHQAHQSLSQAIQYASATPSSQGQVADLMMKRAAIEQQYNDRLNWHNATRALRANDMKSVNAITSRSGVDIMRNPDGTFRVFTDGQPTRHTAVPQAALEGLFREIYDPAMRATRERQATATAEIAMEQAKANIKANAEAFVQQYGPRMKALATPNGQVIMYNEATGKAYDITEALNKKTPGPAGSRMRGSAVPIDLPGISR